MPTFLCLIFVLAFGETLVAFPQGQNEDFTAATTATPNLSTETASTYTTTSEPNSTLILTTVTTKEKPTTKIFIPAMARKAGGKLKPEFQKSTKAPNTTQTDELGSEEDSYSYSDNSSEEVECGRNKFYHVRGRRCVPIQCPGGNKLRNKLTGQCLPPPVVIPSFYFYPYRTGLANHAGVWYKPPIQ